MKNSLYDLRKPGKFLLNNNIYIIVLLLFLVPAITIPGYVSSRSITVLLNNISLLGLLAIGVSFVMILGCNDLSIGANVSLCSVISVLLGRHYGLEVVIPLTMLCGVACGVINGVLVGLMDINPFIATLGTQMMFRGIGMTLTDGRPILNLNASLRELFLVQIVDVWVFKITLPMVILVGGLLASLFVLKYMSFGHKVYVMGGNREAAKLSGINEVKTIIICYMISGLCAGFTGILFASFNDKGNPIVGDRFSLQTVAACVLGGLRMTGGVGSSLRAVLGVAAMQLLQKLLLQIDASIANLQVGIIGAVLIIFLIIDMMSTKVSEDKSRLIRVIDRSPG